MEKDGVIWVRHMWPPLEFVVIVHIDPVPKTIRFDGKWELEVPANEMYWYSRALFMYWRWEKHDRNEQCFENYDIKVV
jgi:hypothetical protein